MAKKKKNIVMYFSMFGKNDKIADIISIELDALKIKIATSGWGLLKIPLHMVKGILERDVVMIPNKNLQDYHRIYIGGPVWAGKPCPALMDLIRKINIKGKSVVLFLTAKEDFGNAETILREAVKKRGAEVKTLFRFLTSENEEKIKKRIKEEGIDFY
ncbi:MAG: hypothetical protein KAS15_04520 [Nanoarchaeota archaeon]|nr:hypothetical protein [Nanoarchaeota archaeon]MCK5629331.1 hypothetical protein [Nanoarchaeota archaeon]